MTFVGKLGHLDVSLPAAVYVVYPLTLLAVAVLDGDRESPLRGAGRAVFLGAATATWFAVMLLAYVGWNAPQDEIVRYVQGRYFIPLAPLLVCALHVPSWSGLSRPLGWLAVSAATGMLVVASIALYQRYWGG